MKRKISLKDIAAKVGVSTALVSYVLNNKKSGRIRVEVAQKIKEAARELNYRPNQIAKSLKLNKTFTLGLIVADISNPFFSTLARIIEDEADKHNYTVIFGSADENAAKSFKLINTLMDRQVDGLIIAPAENAESNIKYLQDHEMPFVLIDRNFPAISTNWVCLNNFKASFSAVQHLLDRGSKKPGLLTYKTSLYNISERKRGYEIALLENNVMFQPTWLKEVSFSEDMRTAVENALDEMLGGNSPVDSILFSSNILATYGLKYIHSRDIRIPDDLALITFDEMDASDLFYAPLTYIKQPIQDMGEIATQILLENIEAIKKTQQVKLEGDLIIRKSTEMVE